MKITRLYLANYKSFSKTGNANDNTLAGIADINMIFGFNNSGKSNLLRFIHLLFQSKISRSDVIVEGERMTGEVDLAFWRGPIIKAPFIFHKNDRDTPIEFSVSIRIENEEIRSSGFSDFEELSVAFSATHNYSTFNIEGEIRKIDDYDTAEMVLLSAKLNAKALYSVDATGRGVYFGGLPAGNALRGDATAFSNFMSMFNDATLFLDNNRYMTTEISNATNLQFSSQTFKNWLHNLSLDPRRNHIMEELTAFIKKHKISVGNDPSDTVFKNVEKNSPFANFNPEFARLDDDTIEIMFRRGRDRFPLSSFGTGIQQLLFILAAIFTSKSRIILIEELELNLSPRYQRELFKILHAMITDGRIDQVFFTTHSKYFNYRGDFSIYEVNIDGNGVSKPTKATATTKNAFFRDIIM